MGEVLGVPYGWQNVVCLLNNCISKRLCRVCAVTVTLYVFATPCNPTLCRNLTPKRKKAFNDFPKRLKATVIDAREKLVA